jgi:hypothetical protein
MYVVRALAVPYRDRAGNTTYLPTYLSRPPHISSTPASCIYMTAGMLFCVHQFSFLQLKRSPARIFFYAKIQYAVAFRPSVHGFPFFPFPHKIEPEQSEATIHRSRTVYCAITDFVKSPKAAIHELRKIRAAQTRTITGSQNDAQMGAQVLPR